VIPDEARPAYPVAALADWSRAVLRHAGVDAPAAEATGRLLVRSDARGYTTHGLARLPSYLQRLAAGDFHAKARLAIRRDGPAWTVDADGGLGQWVASEVVAQARADLREQPMLWVSVKQTGHLGALGVAALEAAEAGLVCLLGQRTPPLLGLPGFTRPAIGHNPFAFASPAGDRPPLVFDMACSVAARGHILAAVRDGKDIPAGWALDGAGHPTTDAKAAAAGSLQPTGGYKGMGLAMMVECLAAALGAQEASAREASMRMPASGAVPRESAFFLFIDPARLGEAGDFAAYMQHWMRHYAGSGAEARLPGERGHRTEQAAAEHGLAYPQPVLAELRAVAARSGIPLPAPLGRH
jgi:LDH2 family malate/lactate/ureidoglycolate dehydrogenase